MSASNRSQNRIEEMYPDFFNKEQDKNKVKSQFSINKEKDDKKSDSFLKRAGIVTGDIINQIGGGAIDAVESAYNLVVPEDKEIEISYLVPEAETAAGRFVRPASQFFIPYTGAYKIAKSGYLFVKNSKNLNNFINTQLKNKKILETKTTKDAVEFTIQGAAKKKTKVEKLLDAASSSVGRPKIVKPRGTKKEIFPKDKDLSKKEAIIAGLGAGALVDTVAFAPYDPNLADLLVQYPATKFAVSEWLQTDPNGDPGMERLKNALANSVPSAVIPLFLGGVSKGFVWSKDSLGKSAVKNIEKNIDIKKTDTKIDEKPSKSFLNIFSRSKDKSVDEQMDELIKGDAGKNVPKGDSTFMDMHSSMSKSNIFSNSIEFIRSKFYRSLTLKKLAIRYLDSTAGIKYLQESASKMGVSVKRLASAYHKTGGLGVYGEARFLNAIGGFVEQFLFNGTFRFKDGYQEATGRAGLEGILKNNLTPKQSPQEFFDYLGAKSLLDLEKKNKKMFAKYFSNEAKLKAGKAQLLKDVKKGDAIPQFQSAMKDINEFNKDLLQFAVDAQILSKEGMEQLLKFRMPYIPFYRDFDADGLFAVRSGGAKSVLKRKIKGAPVGFDEGELPFKNLFNNYIENINNIITTSYKNYVLRNTFDLIDLAKGGLNKWAIKTNTKKLTRIKLKKEEIKQALVKQKGLDADEIDVNDLQDLDNLTLFRSEAMVNGEKEFTVFRAKKDPKTKELTGEIYADTYKIQNPLLLETLQSVSPKQMIHSNALFKIARVFKNILTKGVTLDPGFFAYANAIRDTFTAAIMSFNKFYIPVISTARATFSRVTNTEKIMVRGPKGELIETTNRELYNEFTRYGGSFGSTLWRGEVSDSFLKEFYRKLGHSDYSNVLNRPKKIYDRYADLVTGFENLSRATEYKLLRKAGYSAREAAFASREVAVDFGMHGASQLFRHYTSTVPFLNAGLQGVYRTVRGLSNPAERWAIIGKFTAFSLTPSLFFYGLNRNDEGYFNVAKQIRDTNYLIPKGDGSYFKIPKPFEFGAVATIITDLFETIDRTGDMDKFFNTSYMIAKNQFRFSTYPQIISPFMNAKANKTFYGSNIIPPNMSNSLPDYGQSYPWTSKAITFMVENLPMKLRDSNLIMSPIEYEYYYRSFTGAIGGYILDLIDEGFDYFDTSRDMPDKRLDELPFLKRFLQLDPQKFTQAEADFYQLRKLTAQKIAQAEKFSDEYKLDLFLDFVNYPEYNEMMELNPELEAIGIEASKLNKERNRIINSPGIDGAEKRQQIDVIEQKLLMLLTL